MADTVGSALAALGAAPATNDLLYVIDVSDTSMGAGGTSKKMTVANLFASSILGTAAVKNTGISGNAVPLLDGANTWSAQNTYAAGTITTSQPLSATQTWNAAGVTFTALNIDVTDSASASGSLLVNWQVGGVSKFSVGKDGAITIVGAVTAGSNLTGNNGAAIFTWAGTVTFSGSGDFTGSNSMFLLSFKNKVIAETASRSLTNRTMYVVTNEGATSKPVLTLLTAVAGDNVRFVVQDADGIRIVANTGDNIRIIDKVTANAGYIESTTIGSTVHLVAINATEWIAVDVHGVWTDGTFTYDDTSLTTP